MILYISIFVITALGLLFPKRYQNLFFFIGFIFFIFFIGFRHQVGADWYNYLEMHKAIQNMNSLWIAMYFTEPGYGLLNYYFSGNEGIYIVNFVCSFILCLGYYIFCRQQPYPLLSASIMIPYTMFVMGMGYTRQATAFGFILLAYVSFIKKKHLLTFFYIFLGFLFHRTAIIGIFLFSTKLIRIDRIKETLLFISISIFFLFFIISRIDLGIYGDEAKVSSEGGVFRGLMNLIPALIFFFYYKYFFLKYRKFYSVLYFLSFFSIIFFLTGLRLSTFSDRFAQYFSIIQAVVLPMFIDKFITRDRKLAILLIILFYLFFLIFFFSNSYWIQKGWLPYQNYLFL